MRKPEEEVSFHRPRQRWYAGVRMVLTQDVAIWSGFSDTGTGVGARHLCTLCLSGCTLAEVLLTN
jgi:hypothetical protein